MEKYQKTEPEKTSKASEDQLRREPADDSTDDLEFEVREAYDSDTELVGGVPSPKSDSLGIESPADLMQHEAERNGTEEPPRSYASQPIGESAPPSPMPQADEDTVDELPVEPDAGAMPVRESNLEKLTEDQIMAISQRMRAESSQKSEYLTDEEKMQLVNGLDSMDAAPTDEATSQPRGFDSQPIVPPGKERSEKPQNVPVDFDADRPKMSKRKRGLAFFAKGYIKITGEQELHDGDEMVINGREYVLRQKKISNRTAMITVGSIAAVLMFILGTLISPSADTGAGSIVGVVVDRNDQLVLTGAQIHLPEVNQTYPVNGQGLFNTDRLDAGSYKIEFMIGDEVVGTDYATVVDDRVTMVRLRPERGGGPTASRGTDPSRSGPEARTADNESSASRVESANETPAVRESQTTARNTRTDQAASQTSSSKVTPSPRTAKIQLQANVEGARLTVGGNVLGAGNLTYSELEPGTLTYRVEKDGYQPAKGTIDLKAGATSQLRVNLEPVPREVKEQTYAQEEFYRSGAAALESGNLATARQDLNRAIEIEPSYAEAYLTRAEVFEQSMNRQAAHDDYIRAAEIYQFRGDNQRALNAYQQALNIDDHSVAAYLGRGQMYLSRNESIAAVADFDMVVRLDKRNLNGYMGLGRARLALGYYGKAVKHFKDARSIDPENALVYRYLMLSHFGESDFEEVQKNYDKFKEIATERDIQELHQDSRFQAVLKVVD